jgi:hypothetical protein
MGSDEDRVEQDYTSYRLLIDLWVRENPIKTAKLLVLLATQALLISAVSVAGGPVLKNWPLCLTGAAFSLVWALSLGRTSLFQEGWRRKIREMAARYPEDPRFQVLEMGGEREKAPFILRVMGSIPSAYYLLATPIILLICWLGALAVLLI